MSFSDYYFSLEDETRKIRRNLLLVTIIPFTMELYNVTVTKISFLGIQFNGANPSVIKFLFILVIGYLLVSFIWNFLSEFTYWRTEKMRTVLAQNNKIDSYLKVTPVIEKDVAESELIKANHLEVEVDPAAESFVKLVRLLGVYLGRYKQLSRSLKIKLWVWDIGLPVLLSVLTILALLDYVSLKLPSAIIYI